MKGAQLESLPEMLPGLPKLDDISEPALDEAERVLKKWRRLSFPAKRCLIVPLGSRRGGD
jgi:hypothetical protein